MTSNKMTLFNISQPSMVWTIELYELEDILKKLQASEIFCRRRQLPAATKRKIDVIPSYA